jgi:TPR repeat protein
VPNGGDAGSLEGGLAAEKRGDWKTAFLLLRSLALDGNADAQDQPGIMYETGQGVVPDGSNAEAWYRAAARNGNAHAQTQMGKQVAWPLKEELFRKAAAQGNAEGQFQLRLMYNYGKGVHIPGQVRVALLIDCIRRAGGPWPSGWTVA